MERHADEGPGGAPAGTTHPDSCVRVPLAETTLNPALQPLLKRIRGSSAFIPSLVVLGVDDVEGVGSDTEPNSSSASDAERGEKERGSRSENN